LNQANLPRSYQVRQLISRAQLFMGIGFREADSSSVGAPGDLPGRPGALGNRWLGGATHRRRPPLLRGVCRSRVEDRARGVRRAGEEVRSAHRPPGRPALGQAARRFPPWMDPARLGFSRASLLRRLRRGALLQRTHRGVRQDRFARGRPRAEVAPGREVRSAHPPSRRPELRPETAGGVAARFASLLPGTAAEIAGALSMRRFAVSRSWDDPDMDH
jgi:hypothetical protein